MPNTDGEIHLEKQLKRGIYEEYVDDFEYRGKKAMSYENFNKLWRESFPHVKIRKYKQVSGNKIIIIINCIVMRVTVYCFIYYRKMLHVLDLGILKKQVPRQ